MTEYITEHYESGKLRCEKYLLNKVLHREGGPALIKHDITGGYRTAYYLGGYSLDIGACIEICLLIDTVRRAECRTDALISILNKTSDSNDRILLTKILMKTFEDEIDGKVFENIEMFV